MFRLQIVAILLLLATPAAGQKGRPTALPPPPDLSQEWTSTWGSIFWQENWYSNIGQTLEFEGPRWDPQREAYIVRGNFGMTDGEPIRGGMEFVFTDRCSFVGQWWLTDTPNNRGEWVGQCLSSPSPVTDQDLAATETTGNSDGAHLPPQPDLNQEWTSTWGQIAWRENWYGNIGRKLQFREPVWDEDLGAYILRGYFGTEGGRLNEGGVEFVFSGPCNFEGHWWLNPAPNDRHPWTGQCTAPGDSSTNPEVASPAPDVGSDAPEAVLSTPDLGQEWTSTWGNIVWWENWYNNTGQTLQYEEPFWDTKRNAYVLRGYFGLRGEVINRGGMEFVFTDPCTFTGHWWLNDTPHDLGEWTGQCTEPPQSSEVAANETAPVEASEPASSEAETSLEEEAVEPRVFRLFDTYMVSYGGDWPLDTNINEEWSSTFGTINWNGGSSGTYGEQGGSVGFYEVNWNPDQQAYSVKGTWQEGEEATDRGGLVFVFTSDCEFSGHRWTYAAPDARQEWFGHCSDLPDVSVVEGITSASTAGHTANSDTLPPPPDLTQEWSSSWGNIVWWENRYGAGSDTLHFEDPVWDPERSAYVLHGYFGVRGGETNQGGIEFVFSDRCTFTGAWWYNSSPNNRGGWTGQCAQAPADIGEEVVSTQLDTDEQAITPTAPPPDLTQDFDSREGLIVWSRNVVVNSFGHEQPFSFDEPIWDQSRRAWVITGLSDTDSNHPWAFEFVFSGPCDFDGFKRLARRPQGDTFEWSGSCYEPVLVTMASRETMDPSDPRMAPLWDRYGFTVALQTIEFDVNSRRISTPIIFIDRVRDGGVADQAGLLEEHTLYHTLSGLGPEIDDSFSINTLEDYVEAIIPRLDSTELAFNQFPLIDHANDVVGNLDIWDTEYEQPNVGGGDDKTVLLLRPQLEQHVGIQLSGYRVTEVFPGSPADEAGLQRGDAIRGAFRPFFAHSSENEILNHIVRRMQLAAQSGDDTYTIQVMPAGQSDDGDIEDRDLPARAFNPSLVDPSAFVGFFRNIENRLMFDVLMGGDWTYDELPAPQQNAMRQLYVIYHNKYYDACIVPFRNDQLDLTFPDEETLSTLSIEELNALQLEVEADLAALMGRVVTVRGPYDPMTGEIDEQSSEHAVDVQPEYVDQYVAISNNLRRNVQPFLAQGVFITRYLSTLASDVDAVLLQTGCVSEDLERLEQGLATNAAFDPRPVTAEDIRLAFP